MTPRFRTADPAERARGLAAAVAAVRRGRLVGLPVDTQYGIAADAFSAEGIAAIRAAKGHADLTMPVLVPWIPTVSGIARPDASALRLMRDFWPGPLTLVLPAQPSLAWPMTDARGRVAVRQPLHPVALELLERTGPLAVVGATTPALTPGDAFADGLAERLEVVLDGGELPPGPPSAVIDLTASPPALLRPGTIAAEDLRAACPDLQVPPSP